MRELRVGFVDTFENCTRFFTHILSQRYDVIRDDANPEVLFFSDEFFGNRNKGYNDHATIKIFYTGENARPIFRDNDYAITFDFLNSPYHYRLPLYVLEMWAITLEGWTKDTEYLIHKQPLDDGAFDRGGISYIQSNPNSPHRNTLLGYLMQHFDVHCGGPHLNNTGYVIPREPRMHKLDFLRERKFNIAVENGLYPGYVTEKLLDAYYADTVPIYWGSPKVARDFNPKSFINVEEYGIGIELVDRIKELDQDKGQYMEMLNQPAFTGNVMNDYAYFNEFHNWFANALSIGKVR